MIKDKVLKDVCELIQNRLLCFLDDGHHPDSFQTEICQCIVDVVEEYEDEEAAKEIR